MASRMNPARMETLAELARIELTSEERRGFPGDLNAILTYLGRIEGVLVESNEQPGATDPGDSRLRDDQVTSSLTMEQVQSFVPRLRNGFVVAPRIIKE